MKRFISTKFFQALQEASQNGIEVDTEVLKDEYDSFAMLLFCESAAPADRMAYRNSLVYTRVELESLAEVSGKKCGSLSPQSH